MESRFTRESTRAAHPLHFTANSFDTPLTVNACYAMKSHPDKAKVYFFASVVVNGIIIRIRSLRQSYEIMNTELISNSQKGGPPLLNSLLKDKQYS